MKPWMMKIMAIRAQNKPCLRFIIQMQFHSLHLTTIIAIPFIRGETGDVVPLGLLNQLLNLLFLELRNIRTWPAEWLFPASGVNPE